MKSGAEFLSWSAAFEAGSARCGGKGWNLARLDRYGFDVPKGGVLTAEAYAEILNSANVTTALCSLAQASPEEASKPAMSAALADVRARIESAGWPTALDAALGGFLRRLDCEHTPMAVRSSATAEDGSAASFAGMHRSILYVSGADDIARSILCCYASLWTPQALAYRRRLGFTDDAVSCAVVICAMVTAPGSREPVSAGVTFTCDPATGRRDLIVTHAARGSAEDLAAGRIQPEQVIVRYEKRGRYTIEQRRQVAEPILSVEQALRLAHLAIRIQWALGDGQDPQDVEWAFDGSRIRVLQARPVTALPTFTFSALKHQPVIWSTANIKEAVPGVVSTMCWSLVQDAVGSVLYAAFIAVGYGVPKGLEVVRRIEGRGYFDFTAIQWALYDAMGVPPSQTVASIGGHQPEIAVPRGNPLRGRQGWRRTLARLRLAKRLWGLDHELEREIGAGFQEARRLMQCDWKTMSEADLMQVIQRIAAIFDGLGQLSGLASAGAGSGQELLAAQLRRIAGDRSQGLMTRLLTGYGNVTSAEQGYRIYELAAVARKDEAARAWLQAARPAGEWRLLPPDSPFRREMNRFLEDFGHRAEVEADIMYPRWEEDPGYILDTVRNLLDVDSSDEPAAKARALRKQAEDEIRQLAFWRRLLIRRLAKRLQFGMALRESAKSALGATSMPSRMALMEIGRRLVEAGRLDDASDIFHLAAAEVQFYLLGEWDGRGARALVADRKVQRERWLAASPPDVIVTGSSLPVAQRARPEFPGSSARWPGIGVAPGRAQGTCRILRHPAEGIRFQRGEILVAPATDPAWTPMFLRAAGIVMETGGFLSHGAIVAREYGIPAVANIPGLTAQLCDGATLLVDGDNGTVEAISTGDGPQ